MNRTFDRVTSATATRVHVRARLGAVLRRLGAPLLAVSLGVGLAGCSFLKPAQASARHFVLTPLPAAEADSAPANSLAVGLSRIRLAAYLFNTALAVRRDTNEIDYLPTAFWGERLDTGLQRVLAANLARLLPTDHIRLSAWQREDVSVEVYVRVERFEVDARGQGELVAWWRLLSPGGERTFKAGECHRTRQGPTPDTDPSGAVATLSELVADLSRELAQAIQETTPTTEDAVSDPRR